MVIFNSYVTNYQRVCLFFYFTRILLVYLDFYDIHVLKKPLMPKP